ncbi:MAG: hypothetical protein ACYCV0_11200 [Desulfitobacteriaceae bacterium]
MSLENSFVGAFVFQNAGAAQWYFSDLVPLSDRGLRAGQMHKRFPRNLGGTVTSILSVRWGFRDNNSRLSMVGSQPLGRANNENKRWYRQTKENEVRREAITVVVVPS